MVRRVTHPGFEVRAEATCFGNRDCWVQMTRPAVAGITTAIGEVASRSVHDGRPPREAPIPSGSALKDVGERPLSRQASSASTSAARCEPIASDAVAPGEGAFLT